jgi:predicted acyltransferase
MAILGYNYPGLYVTINFITSTVTTLIGAWTGGLLLRTARPIPTMMKLVEGAVVSFLMVFAFWALVPGVKRIWTATFTFYSAGWVLLMLLIFYYVIEVLGLRRWTFPLVVIGANSIFIYSADILFRGWLDNALGVFTGGYTLFGELGPVLQSCTILLVLWYVNYFLYKHKIFIKV